MHALKLSAHHAELLVPYFSMWDILRLCCGRQMSKTWRAQLQGQKIERGLTNPQYPGCEFHDLDSVQHAFINVSQQYNWSVTNLEGSVLGEVSKQTYLNCTRANRWVATHH